MTTKTCSKCNTRFGAYWRGVVMPDRCRKCEYRHGDKARSKALRVERATEIAAERRANDIRPKHVLGEAGSETWFHSQQTAFAQHMERLGFPKTGPRPSDNHSAAGERPLLGLGGRF